MAEDIVDELFEEMAGPAIDHDRKETTESAMEETPKSPKSPKTPKTPKSSEIVVEKSGEKSRTMIARAFGIEISVDSGITLSQKLQARIDKLLSDVALLLNSENASEKSSSTTSEFWYCSARAADPEEERTEVGTAPSFSTGFNAMLSDSVEFSENAVQKDENSGPSMRRVCFNCEGPHNLSECPEQRDGQKIKKNLLAFRQQTGQGTPGRYHGGKNAKFDKYAPGQISTELREALGLRSDELPPWIYEMRVLGYPPGYIRQLMTPTTSLTVYNDQNGDVNKKEPTLELDPEEVVEYPGFNVPVPKGMREDSRYHTPMLGEHSKENFLTCLSINTGRKIATMDYTLARKNEKEKEIVPEVMEISDDEDEVIEELNESLNDQDEAELLKERQRILEELGKGPPKKKQRLDSGGIEGEGQVDIVDLVSPESPTRDDDGNGECSTPKNIPLTDDATSIKLVSDSPPSTSSRQSVSVESGTPVHGTFLKKSTKPELEKFADGIQPMAMSPTEENRMQGERLSLLKKIISKKLK